MRSISMAAAAGVTFLKGLIENVLPPVSNAINSFKNWKQVGSITGNPSISDIVKHNGTYFAITASGTVWTSTDKVNWTQHAQFNTVKSTTSVLYSIFSDGTYLYISGNIGRVFRSDDNGITWLVASAITGTPAVRKVFSYNGKVYALYSGQLGISTNLGGSFATSANFKTSIGTAAPIDIITFKNMIVIVADNICIISEDNGVTWTKQNSFTGISTPSIAASNELIIAVGLNGISLYSTDAKNWIANSEFTKVVLNSHQNSIACDGTTFVCCGSNFTGAYTTDGIKWIMLPYVVTNTGTANTVYVTDEEWIIGNNGGKFVISYDPVLSETYSKYRILIEDIVNSNGDPYAQLAEVELIGVAGSDLLVPGTVVSESSFYSTTNKGAAVMDDIIGQNPNKWVSLSGKQNNAWVSFSLAVGAKVMKLKLAPTISSELNRSPKHFRFEASSDGTNWITLKRFEDQIDWTPLTFKEFIINT